MVRSLALLSAGWLGAASIAAAQDPSVVDLSTGSANTSAPVSELLRDALLGLELTFLVPRGDFRPGRAVSVGYGVRGALGLGARKMFDIGAGFRSVAHDSRTHGDTLKVKNMLRALVVTGRLVAPLRYARPYVGAAVGGAYFGTETMVEQCCDDEGDREWVLEDIRLARIRPTASARAGLLVDVWRYRGSGQAVLALDLSVEDHYGPRVTYQTDGYGPITRTGTNHRVYSVGLTIRSR